MSGIAADKTAAASHPKVAVRQVTILRLREVTATPVMASSRRHQAGTPSAIVVPQAPTKLTGTNKARRNQQKLPAKLGVNKVKIDALFR